MLFQFADQFAGNGTHVGQDYAILGKWQKKRGIFMCARDDVARLAFQLIVQGRADAADAWLNLEVITDAEMASGDGGLVFAKPVQIMPFMRGGVKLATGPGTTSVWLWVND